MGALRPIQPGETRRVVYDFSTALFGDKDGDDSFAFMYTSDRDEALAAASNDVDVSEDFADYDSGLFGAAIVSRRGHTYGDGAPNDVNREFVLFMNSMDLNKSPYIDMNILQFTQVPESVDKSDTEFKASNVMQSVNGRSYCNLEGLSVLQDRTSRWYVFNLGNDMASPRWYGHAASIKDSHVVSAMLVPGTGAVANLRHTARGTWLV